MNELARRVAAAGSAMSLAASAWVLACGPHPLELVTARAITPAHLETFGRGDPGVVRPRFARRYLVEAYRSFAGLPPLPRPAAATAAKTASGVGQPSAADHWAALRETVLSGNTTDAGVRVHFKSTTRAITGFQHIDNCLDDAFVVAGRTLQQRVQRYGHESEQVRAWLRARDAVFANCGAAEGADVVLPEPPPPAADALTRADRAYQTAAAYFYATRYEDAARRFRTLAQDPDSPWRIYGHYLAARSMIRLATVPNDLPPELTNETFAEAEEDLKKVLADSDAHGLHTSTRGLLDLIAGRRDPVQRVQALSAALAGTGEVSGQQLVDFERLMDKLVGDTTEYAYTSIARRDALTSNNDLADWITSLQGTGEAALNNALERWRKHRSNAWLVAVMWHISPSHAASAEVLGASGRVPRTSPAFPTIAFLRARLLIRSGQFDAARAILADVPVEPRAGFPVEVVNLFAAERLMVARTFEEFLRSAARRTVADLGDASAAIQPAMPVFDEDAGRIFSERLPLARLIDASRSTLLPDRLRLRVATVALVRALLLRRHEEALGVVPVLHALAPALSSDLNRFTAADTAEDKHVAAVRLLLRTPGLHARVQGLEDDLWAERGEAARSFDHLFRRNWWCALETTRPTTIDPPSEVLKLLYPDDIVPYPSFLTHEERAATARELRTLAALETAPNYLAREAVVWARARPKDRDAAEALARAVQGTRWGCSDERTAGASRQAFVTLHRLFPKTEWARTTKYWYGRD